MSELNIFFFPATNLVFWQPQGRGFLLETLSDLWFALSRGAGEKEDAADLVSSLSSYEETATLPWNRDTFLIVEVEKLNYSGKLLVQLAFSNKLFKSL